ncbi:UDP-glucose 4-epimerase [Bdellovibrio bacteriovorus W]|nr:UDP-glucose 4-epimerase [Bdellovibrio bacteriovorus W]
MKVLVTGGAGYIGSHTAQKLIEAGFDVVVLDDLSTGFKEAVPAKAHFIQGDVTDLEVVTGVLKNQKIEAVIHFAAKLIVPESVEKPLLYYKNNTTGVMTMVEAMRTSGVDKIVFSSTAAVYGDASTDGLVNEETPTAPLNPYGHSKLMSEQILKDAGTAYGISSVRLRYFNVAGASVDGANGQRTANATHLIKVSSEAACGKRSQVGVFGTDYPTTDGTGVRDYIHVEDLADLHVLALKYLNEGGTSDVFNCGYGEGFSVKQVIETVKKVSGVDFKVLEEPRRAGDAATLVADSRKVRKAFQWAPQRNNLELICRTAFEWEKSR